MLTITLSIIGIITTTIIAPKNRLWKITISQTSILFLTRRTLIIKRKRKKRLISRNLKTDWLRNPLIILSLWLIPVSLIARIKHLKKKPKSKTREFISLIFIILLALIITFSTKDLILFFLRFERTLIPTLFLITRWGMQQERIEAGYYFVLYTLIRSLPLFISLLIIYKNKNHSCIPLKILEDKKKRNTTLTIFCIIAFLVKVPIFTLHLWLPKAHVEAPVAGSMILAAILLKMGGYGFIRLTMIFWLPFLRKISTPLIPFCCWGGLLTRIICLSQTDLKSLIAYSSVSHMSFMIAGLSLLTKWAIIGRIIMMIAHGIVSSALFSIAKILYEQKKTRTLKIKRGLKKTLRILPKLWLLFACAKFGLPPFPKAIGEVILFSKILKYKTIKLIIILLRITFTAIFSLSIFQLIKRGTKFKWKKTKWKIREREFLMLILHIIPLILLIPNPNLMSN